MQRGTAVNRLTRGELWSIGRHTVAAWIDHRDSSTGAALAFYTLFAIAPILIIAMAIAGLLIGADVAQAHILDQMRALLGDTGAAAVRTLITSATFEHRSGLAAAVGLLTLLVGATSVFSELESALNRIWKTPSRREPDGWWSFIRTRLLSFGLILGVGFLLLVSLSASAALAAFGSWLGSFLPGGQVILSLLDLVLGFAMATVLFAMIFKYVPREKITWGDVWIGAVVTASLFTIGKACIGIYLGRNAVTSAYGAAGSFVVLLLWVYYSAQIFLFGAEFTCTFAYAHGSRYVRATPPSAAAQTSLAAQDAAPTSAAPQGAPTSENASQPRPAFPNL
jgi:membrane protein